MNSYTTMITYTKSFKKLYDFPEPTPEELYGEKDEEKIKK